MLKEKKVWIRGDKNRGTDITRKLEEIGILEDSDFICDDPNCIYFIDHNLEVNWVGIDTEAAQVLMEEYTELNLDTKKEKYHLEPFDKVLARYEDDIWNLDFFDRINYDGQYVCIGGLYEYCIPYNDKTKHLVGTNIDYE